MQGCVGDTGQLLQSKTEVVGPGLTIGSGVVVVGGVGQLLF